MILLWFILASLIGGSGSSLVKFSVNNFPTITLVVVRALLSLLIFFPFLKTIRISIFDKNFKKLILANIFFAGNWIFFAFGIKNTSVIVGQLSYVPTALIVAFLGYLFLRERLKNEEIIGLVLTIVGMLVIVYGSIRSQDVLSFGTPLGNLLVFLGLISWSFYIVASKRISNIYSPSIITFYNFAVAFVIGLFLLPLDLLFGNINSIKISPESILGLVSLALFSSVLFFYLYQLLIKLTSAFTASLVLYPVTILASFLGIIFFNEELTLSLFFGAVIVVGGVIFATYKQFSKKLIENCLASIFRFTEDVNFEVIVVDNGSEDDSPKLVKEKFPQVKLIPNKENLGFTKANNQGIKISKGKYILLLNSDTYLIENSFRKLLDKARSIGESLGSLGPLLLNKDRSIQQSAGFSPHLLQVFWWMTFIDDLPGGTVLEPYHVDHESFYKKDQEVGWVTAAAILVPKAVIAKVGAFDEKIFMYGEEVEWCYRIKKAGYKVYFSPSTQIVHIGRGSSGKISQNAIIGEYRGIIYFYQKHKDKVSLQITRVLLKIGALARILIFGATGRKSLAKFYVEVLKVV